jgi:UTP:GlnB (protein PII) uridylyltransferase
MGQTATDIAGLVKTFVDALSERIRVERVILFGSWARGEASEASDIDLLVVSPDFGRDVLADYALLYGCIPPLDVDVDAIPRTPEQVAAAEPDSFLATVLEDGVVAYPARS